MPLSSTETSKPDSPSSSSARSLLSPSGNSDVVSNVEVDNVQDGASSTSPPSYSTMAAKTVANIKRLQENVLSLNISSPSTSFSFSNSNSCSSSNATNNNNISTVTVGSELCTVQQQQPLLTRSNSARPILNGVTSTPLQPPEEDLREDCPSSELTVQQVVSPVHQPLHDFRKISSPPSPLSSPTPTKIATSSDALVTVDPNWQCSKTNIRDRNSVMCNNSLMADVWFNVGSDLLSSQISEAGNSAMMPQKIPAHKYVLATGSTVFYAMLYGGLSTADANKDVIDVPDVEPSAFLTMLRYLYCDEINLSPDNVLATLYCAKKYIVPHLADACVRYLESSLTARNACLLLSQSILFGETALMERSWEVIDAQAELALTSEGFTDIDFATLTLILARESLNCKETVVFAAAQAWASAECKRRGLDDSSARRREVLGSVLYDIRFPAMNVQDFADHVALSGLLTLQETNDIFLHFTAKKKPFVKYCARPRTGLKAQVCRRFQSSAYRSNQWRYRGRCDAIQFCVDKRIFIIGFGLYGSSSGSSDYTARIELKLTSTTSPSSSHSGSGSSSSARSRLLADNVQTFYSDGSSNTFHVYFDQPVQIEPDHCYTALAVLDGAELSYFGQEGMTEVSVGSVTFQFQGSSESTNGTGIQGGQIPELIFYGPQHEVGAGPETSRTQHRSRTPTTPMTTVSSALLSPK